MKWLRFRVVSALVTFLLGVAIVASLNSLRATLLGSASASDVRLSIRSASGTVRIREDSDLEVDITNMGQDTVTLVEPGDGSSDGWRTPIISWTIVDEKTDLPLHQPRFGRCGNQDSLGFDEVFRLSPGETRRLRYVWLPIYRPGTYRVVVHYENEPSAKWKGLTMGFHNPVAMWRLRHSTKVRVSSNELLITVTE